MSETCSKCGLTVREAMLIALMCDMGARCSTDVINCPGGGKHDYTFTVGSRGGRS